MEVKQKYTRAEAAAYIDKTVPALNTMATRQRNILPYWHEGNKTYYSKITLDNYNNRHFSPV